MKARNFEGAVIIDAGGQDQRGNKNVPGGPEFGSPEWNELFVYALSEAERLGLEIDLNIQSGWNLGGPKVTPEYAAKKLTYSETKVNGGSMVKLSLNVPQTKQGFYKDIAVLAVPLSTKTDEVIDNLNWKLSFDEVGMKATDCSFLLGNSDGKRQKAKLGCAAHRLYMHGSHGVDFKRHLEGAGDRLSQPRSFRFLLGCGDGSNNEGGF